MINQSIIQMANEVRQMLKSKQFNPNARSKWHNDFLLRSEITEVGQEYKRYGKARKKHLAHEVADVAIRALNYWFSRRFTDTDMYKAIEFYTKWAHKDFSDLFKYLEEMNELVDTTSRLNMLEIIAASAVLCDDFLHIDFTIAFRDKMARVKKRPPRFNTAQEHFDGN